MKAKEHHLPLIAAAFGATLLLLVCFPTFAFSHLLCSLDASMGYLFVSEAEGTPWFSNTEFPSVSLGLGGDTWAMGLSVDYAENADSYQGSVPGYSDTLDSVDKKLSNASFRLFARIFPGGREKFVSPYLGLGVGPALTQVEYEGKSTGRRESDSVIRVSYSVSVGSKLRFGSSPFSAFIEGSFGGLGALASSDEEKSVAVPQKGFDFVGVAAGLGVTFP
jgi:opacity protein-like surface antigen